MSYPHLHILEKEMHDPSGVDGILISDVRFLGECILELNQKIDVLVSIVNKNLDHYALEKIKQMGKY